MAAIGQSMTRVDARSKVTGQAVYPGDLYPPNLLHMKVLFARRPHARIRALDTSAAEAYPGVVAVFTAKDVPVNRYGLVHCDQPVLCGPGDDPIAAVVRFVGDRVALVVAETEEAAAAARDLIVVDYEDLPAVTDPCESLKAPHGAPLLFAGRENNIVIYQPIRKGDVDEGFAQADVVVEDTYTTSYQEHAFLQPEAGVAYVDENGRLVLQCAGQWPHDDRRQVSQVLNLPEEKIRVIFPAIGGAFGGREDMSVQILLSLAAWRLHERGIHRPVKIIWSREESMIAHHKRHPMYIRARWGARSDGKVVAAEVEIVADAGAYQSTSLEVLGIAALMCTGPYEIPHVKVDGYAVYTNNITCGAFRGFGGPQAALAAEGQMTKLAECLGLDPVEIRLRNVLVDGALASVGTPLAPNVTMRQVLIAAAEAAGWRQVDGQWRPPAKAPAEDKARRDPLAPPARRLRRGFGIACGFKNMGFNCGYPETSWAGIELYGRGEIEKVVLRQAGADVGQGAHTVMIQMAAEALGVPPERVELIPSDTDAAENSGPASASRLTFMAGAAIRGAAEQALQRWKDEDRPAIATYQYHAPETTPFDPHTGYGTPNITYSYAAQVAEVEVDLDTGHVRVVRIVCADDAGRVINPTLAEGQVEGAIIQGHGYAVLENFIVEDGYIRTPYFSNYLIPTVMDVPEEVKTVLLEYPDPYGPFGVRGLAEVPLIPVAAAVAAAVKDATGVWINALPLTPARVLSALQAAGRANGQRE